MTAFVVSAIGFWMVLSLAEIAVPSVPRNAPKWRGSKFRGSMIHNAILSALGFLVLIIGMAISDGDLRPVFGGLLFGLFLSSSLGKRMFDSLTRLLSRSRKPEQGRRSQEVPRPIAQPSRPAASESAQSEVGATPRINIPAAHGVVVCTRGTRRATDQTVVSRRRR